MKVMIVPNVLDDFLHRCVNEHVYAERKQHAPRQWGILAGKLGTSILVVEAVYYASNVRDVDADVITEYHDQRAPKFGGVYKDHRRGYQSDARDLLTVIHKAEAVHQEILGSIHMHADLHNTDRPDDLSPVISQSASPIDHNLFQASGWPLNMILYVERHERALHWAVTAWVPENEKNQLEYREIPILMQWSEPVEERVMPEAIDRTRSTGSPRTGVATD